ncbi:MAG: TetR/AcrR family transcriptional regulator [bacterium]|nr:TetR/AcrR family transcriptional regulator [bacterium]
MTTVTRRERNKAAIRGRIVDAALELFTQHGIAGVTVDEIAEAADVGKGTIYNYFQTKEDIVVGFMVDLEAQVQAKLRGHGRRKGPLHTVLAGFVRQQFRLKEPHYEFVRVLLGHMLLRPEEFAPYMIEIQKVMDPPLEELFEALRRRGEIRTDVKLPELITAFKTMQLGLTVLWAVEGPPFQGTEQTLRIEMKLFSEGLKGASS